MIDFRPMLGGPSPDDTPLDLPAIQADDALLTALGADNLFGTSADAAGTDHQLDSDQRVVRLLKDWRGEIGATPLPAPLDLPLAVELVQHAPAPRRSLKPMLAVAAAIAGLLLGSAAIGARSATPDSFLWPVTKMLWADRADSVEAGIDAREGIQQAEAALIAGHPEVAETALDYVTEVITRVEERDGRATLESDYHDIRVELEKVTAVATGSSSTSAASTSPTGVPVTPSESPSLPVTTMPSETPVDPAIPVESTDIPTDPGTTVPDTTPPDPTETTDPSTVTTDPTTDPTVTDSTTTADDPQTGNDPSLAPPADAPAAAGRVANTDQAAAVDQVAVDDAVAAAESAAISTP